MTMSDDEVRAVKPGDRFVDVQDAARFFRVTEVDLHDRRGRNFRGVVAGEAYAVDVRTFQVVWRKP